MRSFQEDHEMRELHERAAQQKQPQGQQSPGSGRPSPGSDRRTGSPKPDGRVSPIREAAAIQAQGNVRSKAAKKADDGGDGDAAAATAAPADNVTTFRTNITLAVMIVCILLMAVIAMNSGSSTTLTRPRTIVFFLDGASANDVRRAASLSRAPFVSMLAAMGASTLHMDGGVATHTTSEEFDSGDLIREMLGGSRALSPAANSVLRAAKNDGYTVGLVGAYPLIDEPNARGCRAMADECQGSCLGNGAAAKKAACNFNVATRVEDMVEFINATSDAIGEAQQLVVVRLPVDVPESKKADPWARDDALYQADAAVGRATMAAFKRTAESNENLLVVVAAATAEDPAVSLTYAAFKAAEPQRMNPLTRYPTPPKLADVAAVIAQWTGVPTTAGNAGNAKSTVLCGTGAAPEDCPLTE